MDVAGRFHPLGRNRGYYALVDFTKVKLSTDEGNEIGKWRHINEIPELHQDHNLIIQKAIATLRAWLGSEPVGYKLLPEKYLMSDLRILYETILGYPMDRRNFQRKALASGLIKLLNENYTDVAFKSAH